MTATQTFNYLQSEIHTTIAATVDDAGLPVTCAIDIMDADENGLYFLTAKGKGFYDRMKKRGYLALTGIKGADTLSCVAVSVRGRVRELGSAPLARLFEKNPYIRRKGGRRSAILSQTPASAAAPVKRPARKAVSTLLPRRR